MPVGAIEGSVRIEALSSRVWRFRERAPKAGGRLQIRHREGERGRGYRLAGIYLYLLGYAIFEITPS